MGFQNVPLHQGSIIPRIAKNGNAARSPNTGTVMIQTEAIFDKWERITRSCR